ncbi:glycoside hydrolase family 13 protein [Botryobasidium botryosum FD-172 SS1]|uniref:alpha-amylase n=1 Tax=Botryobasidium botryosum (strain FD-172 SS1) TaxID=930990 RepID=A0A067LXA2_BOTB1|nr:glycoside hydrolase family 13 protein [Botryobasidium botryosum FD-172 SS1]
MVYRAACLAAPILLASTAIALPALHLPTANLTSRAPGQSNNVIIQLFEWNWVSVANECKNFIGPAGYGYVQVSPPQEHIQGGQWWTDYQPVSYTLNSKRGNRQQFSDMIQACHGAGVGVIVDTIWNHMAGIDSGTGVGGTCFTHYNYPGLYQNDNFHHCGLEPGDDIVNYKNRQEVQTCELVNLADLATETDYVRGKLAAYGNDLLSLGADGFRLDAAKHIPQTDIAAILGKLTRPPYISQEVIFGAGEPITPNEYTPNGDVQEFRYTSALKSAFEGQGISSLPNSLSPSNGWVPSDHANVFVVNHDTERNGQALTYKDPNNAYTLAHVFMLAYPFGTPTVLSSYQFGGNDDGSPNNGNGQCSGTGGTNGWLCQHRWPAIAGLVGLRNKAFGTPVANQVTGSSQQIAFSRGAVAFVAINNDGNPWSKTFATSLPDGSYCDVANGAASGSGCTGPSYTISGGNLNVNIPAHSAIALHTGAMGDK